MFADPSPSCAASDAFQTLSKYAWDPPEVAVIGEMLTPKSFCPSVNVVCARRPLLCPIAVSTNRTSTS
jgi:hypothetical protein